MKTFVLIDSFNLFHRAKFVSKSGDIDTKIGFCLHVMFNALRKCYRDFNASHAVLCLEDKSWRKDYYPEYKYNRALAASARTEEEQEEFALFIEAFNDFEKFMTEKTNCTTLHAKRAEADDMIAAWIQRHPDDKHVILSTDRDFYQLISDNVSIYNGVTEELITIEGIFDKKGKPVIEPRTKKPKDAPEPAWLLFEKCIRGDKSDYIMPAYPGAREKGSKNKVGMRDAFADMENKGFAWNNFMLTKLLDPNGNEYTVKEKYEFNKKLVDLTMQPEDVKERMNAAIDEAYSKPTVNGVGFNLLKFCATWNLVNISKYPDEYAYILNSGLNN